MKPDSTCPPAAAPNSAEPKPQASGSRSQATRPQTSGPKSQDTPPQTFGPKKKSQATRPEPMPAPDQDGLGAGVWVALAVGGAIAAGIGWALSRSSRSTGRQATENNEQRPEQQQQQQSSEATTSSGMTKSQSGSGRECTLAAPSSSSLRNTRKTEDNEQSEGKRLQQQSCVLGLKMGTETIDEEEKKRNLKDVVVIGCGASGIAALSKLHEAGLDVVGLEAADRIGGRIYTTEFGDGVVDLGAAWCHGEEGNKVYELASPHTLLGRPEGEEDEWFIFSNGTLMPTGNAQNIIARFKKVLDEVDKNNSKSISECIREDVKRKPIVELGKIPIKDPFIEWYERDNHLCGQDDAKKGKSLNGLQEHRPCEGEFWLNWKGKGYKTILDVLLHKPPYSANPLIPDIKLNAEVTSIQWQLEDADDEKPYVQVTCADGTTYKARSVVVTVSIGVLKESHTRLFTPTLPTNTVKAIENLQFCVLDKIYIEFATQWWPKSPASFKIIWNDKEKSEFSQNDKWITEIYGLRTVENHPKVLLAWIYGKGAETMEEKSEEEIRAGVTKLMDKIFSLNFQVPRIVSIKRSQWASNKLIRGSYSYRGVSTEEVNTSAADLATPLRNKGKSVVYFAGEATSISHHNAVHGAIETGFDVADEIIRTSTLD